MNTMEKVIIFFVIVILVCLVWYNYASQSKSQNDYFIKNDLCIQITQNMKATNESQSCVDYYCYYAPYAPPKEFGNQTETLCVCECKLVNGTINTVQVLGYNPTYTKSGR